MGFESNGLVSQVETTQIIDYHNFLSGNDKIKHVGAHTYCILLFSINLLSMCFIMNVVLWLVALLTIYSVVDGE